jgi:hypothetical protein
LDPPESLFDADAVVEDRTNEVVTVGATVGVVAVGTALFEVALLPAR